MKIDNLRVNELDDETYQWYLRYLDALDAKDIEAYGGFLAPGVELVVNNADPVVGHEAVTTGLARYWQSFGALEHDLLVLLGSPRAIVLEALNHYAALDGRKVTLRAVAVTERADDGRATSVRLYTDTAPLFAPS